jgi:hypothetical protein
MISVIEDIVLDEREIEEVFVRAGGGQPPIRSQAALR